MSRLFVAGDGTIVQRVTYSFRVVELRCHSHSPASEGLLEEDGGNT